MNEDTQSNERSFGFCLDVVWILLMVVIAIALFVKHPHSCHSGGCGGGHGWTITVLDSDLQQEDEPAVVSEDE